MMILRNCIGTVFVALILLALIGCGGNGPANDLTPEQREYIQQSRQTMENLRDEIESALDTLRERASDIDVDRIADEFEESLAETNRRLERLRAESREQWDNTRAAFDESMEDLRRHYESVRDRLRNVESPVNLP